MKKYNSSALSTNRAEVLEEAAKNGVIIQEKNTNGKVRREFVLVPFDVYESYAETAGIESQCIDGFDYLDI